MASAAGPALSSTSEFNTRKSSTDKSSTSILTGTGTEEAIVLALEALGFKVVQRNVILHIPSGGVANQDMQKKWHLRQVAREYTEGKLTQQVFRSRWADVCAETPSEARIQEAIESKVPFVTEVDIILQSPRKAQLNEHLFKEFVTGFTSSLGNPLSVTDIIQLLRGQFLVEVTAWGGQAPNCKSKTNKLKTLLRVSHHRHQNLRHQKEQERVLLLYNGTEPTSPPAQIPETVLAIHFNPRLVQSLPARVERRRRQDAERLRLAERRQRQDAERELKAVLMLLAAALVEVWWRL